MSDDYQNISEHLLLNFTLMTAGPKKCKLVTDLQRPVDWRVMFAKYIRIIEDTEDATFLHPEHWTPDEWSEIKQLLLDEWYILTCRHAYRTSFQEYRLIGKCATGLGWPLTLKSRPDKRSTSKEPVDVL